MNTVITFTLKDLLLCGLYLALIAMIIYIIKLLIKLNTTAKAVQSVVQEHKEEIDLILKEAPAITKNVNTISEEVAHDITQFRGTIDNIAETSESVTGVVKDNQTVVDGLTSIFHTASMAKNTYDKFFSKSEATPDEAIPEESINDANEEQSN